MQLTLSSINLLLSLLATTVLAQDINSAGSDLFAKWTAFATEVDTAYAGIPIPTDPAAAALSQGNEAAATSNIEVAVTSIAKAAETVGSNLRAEATSLANSFRSAGDAAAATSVLNGANSYVDEIGAGVTSLLEADPTVVLSEFFSQAGTIGTGEMPTMTPSASGNTASSKPTMSPAQGNTKTSGSTTSSTSPTTSPGQGTASGGGSGGGSGAAGLFIPGAVALIVAAAGCAALLI